MNEPCPPNLDDDGQSLWEQCDWIVCRSGAVEADANLQMLALYIRRELRMESQMIGMRQKIEELAEDRKLIPPLPDSHIAYADCVDIGRCNYDTGITIGMLRAFYDTTVAQR